jgi:hypothetical protein
MHAEPHRYPAARRPAVHRRLVAALSVSLSVVFVTLLAALPTASASAAPSTPGVTLPATVSAVPSSEVEALLSGVSLSDLNTTRLTEALAKLPGLSTLPAGKLKEALTKAIEGLTGKGGTLGRLLQPSEIVPGLEVELKKLLSLPELLSLLKGENLTTKLTAALGSTTPSELLDTLLGSTGNPEATLTQLFSELNPEALKTLLGATLAGEPFSKTTVGELAGKLGMSTETLTKALDTTTAQLPEDATALTAPLTDGKALGVLDGLSNITLGLLGSPTQEKAGGEGSGGSGSGGGSGGSGSGGSSGSSGGGSGGSGSGDGNGGSGGAGSGGAPGTTTVSVNVPLAQTAPIQPSTAKGSSTKKAGKIKILSYRVRGRVVTLVVRVPAAGTVALGGSGVRLVRRQTAKAERVTLRTVLTRAGVASLRRHRHGLRVKLEASFEIAGGSSSSAVLVVNFA